MGAIRDVSIMRTKKWELGVAISAGVSGAKSGLNFLGGNKRMDAAPMATAVQPPFSYNSSSSAPKTIRNNFAFAAGIAARKPISERFGFSTGVLYEYLSTLSSVGVRINQANAVQGAVGNALYYTSYTTKQQEYFNQYHFISVPVSFDYQLLKHRPLRIHAGVSVKQLVRTNALQFDHQSQIYYYNRNAFNRTQLFPGFGIEYAFLRNRSLVIGPQVEGGLVALEKNGSNEHLFSGSVKAQWFFLKK
jgi:hypothetical protein